MSEGNGVKFDTEKCQLELFPTRPLEEIGWILTHGSKKYGPWNWAGGMKWSRLLGACYRHLFAWARGEDKDPESGRSHLAHAACCLIFLLEYQHSHPELDDRYKE